MPEEKEEKKDPVNWMKSLFSFFSELINTLVLHSDSEIKKLKEKAVHYIVVYSLFTVALVFILIGCIKYFFPNEGIGFIVTGCVMIVLLAGYSLFKKL
jgi:hypothetical protein